MSVPASLANRIRRRPRPQIFGIMLFVLLALCIYSDINRFSIVVSGSANLLSPVYLLLCVLVFLAFRFRFWTSLGRAGHIYLFFLLFYMALSSVVRLGDFSDLTIYVVAYRIRTFLTSLLFLLAAALGAYHMFKAFEMRKALWILVFCSAAMPFGVLLGKVTTSAVASAYTKDQGLKSGQAKALMMDRIGRNVGVFGDPNQAGMFLTSGAVLAFACLSVAKTSHERIMLLALIAVFGACVVTTFSRSAIMAFMIMVISQITLSRVIRGRAAFLAGAIGLAGVGWFITVGYEQFDLTKHQKTRMEDFGALAQGKFDPAVTGHRFVVAGVGLKAWAESPVFGHGIGRGVEFQPHNEFIRIMVDAGVVGVLPFIFFFVTATLIAFRCEIESTRNLVIGFLAVFLCSCMTLQTNLVDNVPSLMLGICFAALAVADEESRQRRTIDRQRSRPATMPNHA